MSAACAAYAFWVIDLKQLSDPAYRSGMVRKGADPALVDKVLELSSQHRDMQLSVEELRNRSNTVSKEIGKASPDERPAKIEAAGLVKADLMGIVPNGSNLYNATLCGDF